MRVRYVVGAMVVACGVSGASQVFAEQGTAAAPPARLVVLTVADPVGEKMEYSRKQIVAKPGERLRVQVISSSTLPKTAMAHNFVLLKAGSDPKKFSEAAALAKDTEFIPPAMKSQVIAKTDLVGPGERAEVTFTVPKVPGTYPYLCTFAGHYAAGMWGDLVVK